MYGIFKPLTKENIFKKISSYDIFVRYCSGFTTLGKMFKSPLRADDNDPSASIIYYDGDLLFTDFGLGSFRSIDFVSELKHLTFHETLERINIDFNLKLSGTIVEDSEEYIPMERPVYEEKGSAIIEIKSREWEQKDYNYWYKKYRITFQTLDKFQVKPISHFTINGILYVADELAYSFDYYWEDDIYRRKIYQPYSEFKWASNGGKIVQGEGMLPKHGDLLIITSSLKDAMVLYELGFIAIAPTAESAFVPETYFYKQKRRFKRIILFMDSDEPGIKANKKLSEKLGLFYIVIPEEYKVKDISDFVDNYSKEEAKNLLLKILNI